MVSRMIIFLSILLTILGLAGFYIGERIVTWTDWGWSHQVSIWLTIGLLVILQVAGPLLYRVFPDKISRFFIFHWIAYMSLGVFFCMLFYTVVADMSLGVATFFLTPPGITEMHHLSLLVISVLIASTVIMGGAQAAAGPKVYEIEIPLRDLPLAFDGFRIVQISDLHVGPTIGRKYVEQVVSKVNSLQPDIVALTGDIIDGPTSQTAHAVEALSGLTSQYGSYYSPGNHEYYWGVENSVKQMEKLGAKVLLNENVSITKDGVVLAIAGVTDLVGGQFLSSHTFDPQKAVAGIPRDAVKIVMAHQPSSYKKTSQAGFHLQLSGHTHGGQFFPWSIVVSLAQKYYKGLNRFENMWVYVSRGTGTWGPPLRFGVPAEVTLLKLRCSNTEI